MASAQIRVNIEEPRYDQSTYSGRAKHFFITTNPLNLFTSGKQLDEAKDIVERYRKGEVIPKLTEDKLWEAKHLYDSAFHPDAKEKMFILGRMSAQVPMNMTITGCMMTFYKTTPAVIFWQWFNQTFNAIVNYTNRSGDTPISPQHLGVSYAMATGGAVTTALTLNNMVKKFPPLIGRFVPFAAVAAANCINIPCMRSKEIMSGVPVFDENGNRLGESQWAATKAISQVVVSRIFMATPGMLIPPFIMNGLDKKPFLQRRPWLSAPIQVGMIGFLFAHFESDIFRLIENIPKERLVFATPLCCALFPQKSSMAVTHLEPELRDKLKALPSPPSVVYFNKGL